MTDKLIAVVGATGLQGGAAVEALLSYGFSVRAVTRNTKSSAAKRLSASTEVVQADLTDKDSLVKAFQGAHGVFLNTDTHSCGGDPVMEAQQGQDAADAAKEAGVHHLVFSSLEDPTSGLPPETPETQPGRKLAVFEVKAEISRYIEQHGPPATHLITAAYYENYLRWYQFQRLPDGTFQLGTNVGHKPFAQNAVADIGLSAAVAFTKGAELFGRSIPVVSESISMPNVLAIIGKVTGRQIRYIFVPDEKIRRLPFAWSKEIANMYFYFREGGYQAARPSQQQIISGVPFAQWAYAHQDRLLQRLDQATESEIPFNPGH